MKKYAFVLLAGSIIGLSACGNDSNTNTQEQIDSAVNAKTAELEAARNAQTDSILNEMARMKADSAAMADSMSQAANTSSTTVTKTTTTTKTTKPAATKPTTTKPVTNPTTDVKSGGFGSQSDINRKNDKAGVEGGGFGSQADQKTQQDKRRVEGGGFGSQADDRK